MQIRFVPNVVTPLTHKKKVLFFLYLYNKPPAFDKCDNTVIPCRNFALSWNYLMGFITSGMVYVDADVVRNNTSSPT